VRIYPVQVPLTPALTNLVVDVTDVISQVSGAMQAYTTQLPNMPRAIRQRRYAACRYGLRQYAEEFCQLSTDAYARLHREDAMHQATGFRGVREHPISDPLAYAAGWRTRKRLADQISR
jgi:hypothetical protein